MRVMLTAFPQMCHLYPLLPYAQALQNAGHEVVVACPPGGAKEITEAGLTAVTCGEPEPHSLQNWARHGLLPSPEKMEQLAADLEFTPEDRDHWDVYYQFFLFASRYYLPPEPRDDIDRLVAFARDWQPDLVLWDSWFPVGGVVAKAAGAAHARVLIGPDYAAWAIDRFAQRRADKPDLEENPLVPSVRTVAERFGVEVDEEVLLGQWTIDPLPEEMQLSTRVTTLPVRWAPYNGGGEKPEWLHRRPQKPRVAVTLGVSTRTYNQGEARLPKILEAVAGLDIEVVATLNDNQLVGAPPIPDNVRVVDYVPLNQLLPTCSAVIHHGSSGTFWAAHAASVPQLITDTDEPQRMIFSGEGDNISVSVSDRHADSWVSGKYVTDHGAGVRLNHQTQSAAEIRELLQAVLTDPSYAEGAAALHARWRSRPGPADIVPDLEKLTQLHCRER